MVSGPHDTRVNRQTTGRIGSKFLIQPSRKKFFITKMTIEVLQNILSSGSIKYDDNTTSFQKRKVLRHAQKPGCIGIADNNPGQVFTFHA